MTTIMASALRPIRLNGPRALRLGATAESAHAQSRAHPVSRRSAATYTTPPKPAPPRSPVSQSTYKRSATTSTNSYSSPSAPKPSTSTSPSYSSSPSSSTTSAPSAKPATSPAKGENQTSSVSPAYSQPPGVGPIPETGNGAASSDPAFGGNGIDWSSSFHGLSTNPFSPEVAAVLMAPLPFDDVEIKPDGIIYLPEIKYRRILNQAFGPGGWGMAPRGDLGVGDKVVTREYALLVHGRFIAQARGECQFFGGDDGIATAGEGCKSNALMRCCKDLGIASELWDPRYIREFKKKYGQEIWVEHVPMKKKRLIWVRKGDDPLYPYKKT